MQIIFHNIPGAVSCVKTSRARSGGCSSGRRDCRGGRYQSGRSRCSSSRGRLHLGGKMCRRTSMRGGSNSVSCLFALLVCILKQEKVPAGAAPTPRVRPIEPAVLSAEVVEPEGGMRPAFLPTSTGIPVVFRGGLAGKGKEREVIYYHPKDLAAFTSQPGAEPSTSSAPHQPAAPQREPSRSQPAPTAATTAAASTPAPTDAPQPAQAARARRARIVAATTEAPPSPRRTRSTTRARQGPTQEGSSRHRRARSAMEDVRYRHDESDEDDEDEQEGSAGAGMYCISS